MIAQAIRDLRERGRLPKALKVRRSAHPPIRPARLSGGFISARATEEGALFRGAKQCRMCRVRRLDQPTRPHSIWNRRHRMPDVDYYAVPSNQRRKVPRTWPPNRSSRVTLRALRRARLDPRWLRPSSRSDHDQCVKAEAIERDHLTSARRLSMRVCFGRSDALSSARLPRP